MRCSASSADGVGGREPRSWSMQCGAARASAPRGASVGETRRRGGARTASSRRRRAGFFTGAPVVKSASSRANPPWRQRLRPLKPRALLPPPLAHRPPPRRAAAAGFQSQRCSPPAAVATRSWSPTSSRRTPRRRRRSRGSRRSPRASRTRSGSTPPATSTRRSRSSTRCSSTRRPTSRRRTRRASRPRPAASSSRKSSRACRRAAEADRTALEEELAKASEAAPRPSASSCGATPRPRGRRRRRRRRRKEGGEGGGEGGEEGGGGGGGEGGEEDQTQGARAARAGQRGRVWASSRESPGDPRAGEGRPADRAAQGGRVGARPRVRRLRVPHGAARATPRRRSSARRNLRVELALQVDKARSEQEEGVGGGLPGAHRLPRFGEGLRGGGDAQATAAKAKRVVGGAGAPRRRARPRRPTGGEARRRPHAAAAAAARGSDRRRARRPPRRRPRAARPHRRRRARAALVASMAHRRGRVRRRRRRRVPAARRSRARPPPPRRRPRAPAPCSTWAASPPVVETRFGSCACAVGVGMWLGDQGGGGEGGRRARASPLAAAAWARLGARAPTGRGCTRARGAHRPPRAARGVARQGQRRDLEGGVREGGRRAPPLQGRPQELPGAGARGHGARDGLVQDRAAGRPPRREAVEGRGDDDYGTSLDADFEHLSNAVDHRPRAMPCRTERPPNARPPTETYLWRVPFVWSAPPTLLWCAVPVQSCVNYNECASRRREPARRRAGRRGAVCMGRVTGVRDESASAASARSWCAPRRGECVNALGRLISSGARERGQGGWGRARCGRAPPHNSRHARRRADPRSRPDSLPKIATSPLPSFLITSPRNSSPPSPLVSRRGRNFVQPGMSADPTLEFLTSELSKGPGRRRVHFAAAGRGAVARRGEDGVAADPVPRRADRERAPPPRTAPKITRGPLPAAPMPPLGTHRLRPARLSLQFSDEVLVTVAEVLPFLVDMVGDQSPRGRRAARPPY